MSFKVNIESVTDSYNAYKDYYYGGNTRGISEKEIGAIESRWSANLSTWKVRAQDDENEYEIDDSDYKDAKANGKENAKNETGVKSDSWKKNAPGTAVSAGASVVGAVYGGKVAVNGAHDWVIKGSNGTATTQHNGKKASSSAYIAAGIAIANAALYYARKPNKEEVEACNELKEEILPEAQSDLSEANSEMSEASANVIEWTEEANDINEEANEKMAEQKTQFDMYKESLLAIKEKVASGQELTESEKSLYESLIPLMEECGVTINDISEETLDAAGNIYSEIENQQDIFDSAAETVAEVEGLTDYAKDLDRATRTMCTVEAASQGINAATGYAAGARLISSAGLNFFAYALGVAAIGAGAASTVATAEQGKYLKEVNDEVSIRKDTQAFDNEVSDAYDEQIDMYDDNIGIVEDLEIEVPDDLEIPEDMDVPDDTDADSGDDSDTIVMSPDANSSNTSYVFDKDKDKDK